MWATIPSVRIGTWNLDAKWTGVHASALVAADCDAGLLTEVKPNVTVNGYSAVWSPATMSRGQHYAALLSRLPTSELEAPHRPAR